MRFFLTPLVIIMLLSSAITVATPMSSVSVNADALQSLSNEQSINNPCHLNNATAACCYNSCDYNYASLFTQLEAWVQLSAITPFTTTGISLYSIYQQPVIPPPITA
jgi:hypothetical protein